MTVTEKLAHAAERKAFETMLDSLIRKSRTQDVGNADDPVSMVQKIHSSVWDLGDLAMHKIANDPSSKWAHYAESVSSIFSDLHNLPPARVRKIRPVDLLSGRFPDGRRLRGRWTRADRGYR